MLLVENNTENQKLLINIINKLDYMSNDSSRKQTERVLFICISEILKDAINYKRNEAIYDTYDLDSMIKKLRNGNDCNDINFLNSVAKQLISDNWNHINRLEIINKVPANFYNEFDLLKGKEPGKPYNIYNIYIRENILYERPFLYDSFVSDIPLSSDIKDRIMDKVTKYLANELKEITPGKEGHIVSKITQVELIDYKGKPYTSSVIMLFNKFTSRSINPIGIGVPIKNYWISIEEFDN